MVNDKMVNIKNLFDSNALWISMVIGALGHAYFLPLKPILPWLIFFMLFFTFCKVNPLDLRLHRWHWVVLAAQMTLSFGVYALVRHFTHDHILAQGLLMCFIMPTATAAPIIAGKLGGSIQNLTTFTLLSNFATALIGPATFPLINPATDMTFWPAFLLILKRIAPLLLGPFFLAWAVRAGFNTYYRRHNVMTSSRHNEISDLQSPITNREFSLPVKIAVLPFYLWLPSSSLCPLSRKPSSPISNLKYPLSSSSWLPLSLLASSSSVLANGSAINYPHRPKDGTIRMYSSTPQRHLRQCPVSALSPPDRLSARKTPPSVSGWRKPSLTLSLPSVLPHTSSGRTSSIPPNSSSPHTRSNSARSNSPRSNSSKK